MMYHSEKGLCLFLFCLNQRQRQQNDTHRHHDPDFNAVWSSDSGENLIYFLNNVQCLEID